MPVCSFWLAIVCVLLEVLSSICCNLLCLLHKSCAILLTLYRVFLLFCSIIYYAEGERRRVEKAMITIEQIKAGRALLEWTQEDLAREAGLSKPSINMLERRVANPKRETLEAIQSAMETAGVEFTEGPGVKLTGTVIKTYVFEGNGSLLRLLRDIFETLHGTDKEILISGIDEEKYKRLGGKAVVQEILKRVKHGIKTKLLICEGDTNFIEPPENYRWVPKAFFSQTPYYVYDNKYAILLWGPPQKVVIIENEEIADSYRQQFLAHWDAGEDVKK